MEILKNLTTRLAVGDSTVKRDPASEQLATWGNGTQSNMQHNPASQEVDKDTRGKTATTSFGTPAPDLAHSMTVGPRGPMLIQDTIMIENNAAFNRQRPAERAVHSKGAGAFGTFKVTDDISKYCKADVFSSVGKETPTFVRFSTVQGERGSADTVRDPRGFSVKFYTQEGNWDLVGNNFPVFWVRDPLVFPDVNKAQQRNPATGLRDAESTWDFFGLRPEVMHHLIIVHSPRGIPDGYRHMHGFGINTFKNVNNDGHGVWVKYHLISKQGIKNLTTQVAAEIAGTDGDYATRDLYNSIERGNYPEWDLKIQVMQFEEAAKQPFNPFDATKIWPHKDFPLIQVGTLTLNSNPTNYILEVEQAAFSPSNMPPGIEASPDKILQGRLFAYPDSHRYRIGPNFNTIPVNCPFKSHVANYQINQPFRVDNNRGGQPNYFPNSFGGPKPNIAKKEHVVHISGDVDRFNDDDADNYSQATILWDKVLSEQEREETANNICATLSRTSPFIQQMNLKNFSQVSPDMVNRIQKKLDAFSSKRKEMGEGGSFSSQTPDPNAVAKACGFPTEPTKTGVDAHGVECGAVIGESKGKAEPKPSVTTVSPKQ